MLHLFHISQEEKVETTKFYTKTYHLQATGQKASGRWLFTG